jgi:hypothetical protein
LLKIDAVYIAGKSEVKDPTCHGRQACKSGTWGTQIHFKDQTSVLSAYSFFSSFGFWGGEKTTFTCWTLFLL